MQSELNWNNHNNGVKHKKSISTLLAAEALGVAPQCHQYEQPIGCATPGNRKESLPHWSSRGREIKFNINISQVF